MTLNEVSKIISYIKAIYPNAYKDMTDTDMALVAKVWKRHFDGYSMQEVLCAVDTYVSSDVSGYQPNIGKIKNIISNNRHINDTDPEDAWAHVVKNLQGSIQNPNRQFKKLTKKEQQALGTPLALSMLGRADSKELEFQKQNFIKRYKEVQKEDIEYEMLPSETKALIENMSNRLSMDDEE